MAEPNDEQTTTKITTTGNSVRIEVPSAKNRHKPKVSVVDSTGDVVTNFVGFLREHAVVALAVGFVIATQVQTLAKALVSSFIDPLYALLFGQALSQRTFTLQFHNRSANFGWGGFVYALLDFLFVLAALYAIIKFFKLDKLDKPEKKKSDN